jgi:hypothetical protein
MSFRTVQECRCCGNRRFETVLSLGDLPIGDDFRSVPGLSRFTCAQDLLACADCGLILLSNVVDPSIVYQDQSYLYQTSISPGLPEHFLDASRHLAAACGLAKTDLVVDIGCNDGTLLKSFQSQGHARLHGFEPTPSLASRAGSTGIPVSNGFFSAATRMAESAMLVTANNVFANIDDLGGFVEGVRALLDPKGTFVVETGYGIDLVQNAVLDNIYHEHLSYFTLRSLGRLFERHGMEIWNAERVHTKGGSLRCYVQMANGPRRPERAYLELATLETELGFDTTMPFPHFARRLETSRDRIHRWMATRSKPLAGFGASVGTVTVLEYFGLHSLVSVLYDDNPIKFDTYSPLRDIPVRASSRLAEDRPDTVAILPWRYRHRILAGQGRYLREGGRFLSVLPQVALHGADGVREVES